jgi:hypothetical protein
VSLELDAGRARVAGNVALKLTVAIVREIIADEGREGLEVRWERGIVEMVEQRSVGRVVAR